MNHNATERPLNVQNLLNLKGDIAIVECISALPPGSRVYFEITKKNDETLRCNGKIININKTSQNTFKVSVRLHTFPKGLLEDLQQIADQNTF